MIKIFGYLKHHIKCQIICDAVLLEYQGDFDLDINWSEIYPDAVEYITPGMPHPKGKPVSIIKFVDADHKHDLETRRSVTKVIIFLNKNPT